MQYVMFMIPSVYGSADADEMPSPEMVDAMMTYNQELADAGVLESLNGLHPPTAGVQVRFGADGSSVSEMESAGAVGGYWILNVSSHEAAVEWARRCPALPSYAVARPSAAARRRWSTSGATGLWRSGIPVARVSRMRSGRVSPVISSAGTAAA